VHHPGRDWHDLPSGRLAKLTLSNGCILDILLPRRGAVPVKERFLTAALQFYRDDDSDVDSLCPIREVCGVRLERMACYFCFYDRHHPRYGGLFASARPGVCVAALAEMVIDATYSKYAENFRPSLEFDPRD
jgi:hypothetical protein